VRFLDYYAKTYLGINDFILNGDFVVPLSSQTAGLNTTAPNNISVYSGYYANHTNITQDLEVGDRVLQLINSPVSSSLFDDIPATHNTFLAKNYSIQSSGTAISAIDTNKIKILSPANLSNYNTDSVIVVKIQIKDTVSLQYVELNFQGENYLTDSISTFINFNVQVKSEFLENQQIIATAVYDVTDTTKFLSDTVNVIVSIDQPVQDFTAAPELNLLLKNETIYPDYYATYTTFVTKVGNNNTNLAVTISDPNIVSMDSLSLGFTGKNDGETFAIISYGGVSDTVYFAVNGTSSALPVELTSFTASTDSDKVLLKWKTATEVNNYGFEIERKTNNTSWQKIGFVLGHGNSNSPKEYLFKDNNSLSGKYTYRLKQIDNDGKYKYSKEIEVEVVPLVFELLQNYPNPFNPSTTIKYSLAKTSLVKLRIYDILGSEVKRLVDEVKLAGNYEIKFNANQLASGVYFYQIKAGDFVKTKKLILIK